MSNDLFEDKNLSPMLLYETEPFNSKDYIFELKLDGIRAIAYLDKDKTIIKNKHNKDITNIYPELQNIHKQVKKRCILDGEVIIMTDNHPDFFTLQARSLLVNPLKIKLSAKINPATFVAFDILYYDKKDLCNLELLDRKALLASNVLENKYLSYTRYLEEKGIEFYELAKANNLEGIVAKEKKSKYYPGKRSRAWLKIKVMQEDDVIICGYVERDGTIKDLILGIYDQRLNLHYFGTIYLGVSAANKRMIMEYSKKYPSLPLFDLENDEITWMKPMLVGTVKYMMKTKKGGRRQPVFKGLRFDKNPTDCVDDSL